jgi:hypothetical protein
MKLTKSQLKQLIKEELRKVLVLQEDDAEDQCRAAAARKADAGRMPERAIRKFYKMCLKSPTEAEAWAKKVT